MILRTVARPLLASSFVLTGINAFRDADQLAAQAKPVTDRVVPLLRKVAPVPDDPAVLTRINAAVQVAAGLALATGRFPRTASVLLATTVVRSTVVGHAFWQETDAEARRDQQGRFVKNMSLLGGVLLAGADTEGRPGIAWRARRAARDTRREAARLARNAQREAKLVRAQLT